MQNPSNKNLQFLAFPKDFLWGVSTSPHQIEGGNKNDWTAWESSPERLSDLKSRHRQVVDYRSAMACNSWSLFEEDFNLVEELHCGAYRLGVEWSRIEPELGQYNKEAIRRYKKMLRSLKQRRLKVVLTLWHWTNPLWLAKIGGWSEKASVDYFERYVELCVKEFGKYVDFWVVLNEPLVHIANGYLVGKFPPNKKTLIGAYKTFNHLILAQKIAFKIIRSVDNRAQIGFTTLANFIEPARKNNFFDIILAKLFNYWWNWRFVAKTVKYCDFIGLDYYFHDQISVKAPFRRSANKMVTDLGWEVYPRGIYEVIKLFSKFEKPLYIMENGLADASDHLREKFIKDHLRYVHKALADGYLVKGYFHWSLIDNFEWAEGFAPQFGLYRVDRKTFERSARPSAETYSQICQENGFWLN